MQFIFLGIPIPKRQMPPEDAIEYYTDPKNRGYLADPDLIALERFKLAQKYGYELPDLQKIRTAFRDTMRTQCLATRP